MAFSQLKKYHNYTAKDITIIIATYNRSEELAETLNYGIPFINEVSKILIIDQSTDHKTRKLIKSKKNIKYYHINPPSLTKARNFGVKKNKTNLILFLDDDVTLDKEYLKAILEIFNKYPEAKGVMGFQKNLGHSPINNLLRKFFCLENSGHNTAQVKSVYGTSYPYKLNKIINASFLTGYNMAYKKEVFNKFSFDEKLSQYALAEDFDFSYRIYKNNPKSLFMTPNALVIHRYSSTQRNPTAKAAYMNQINHFYLNYKNFNKNFSEKIIFYWVLSGILLLRTAQLLTFNKNKYIAYYLYLNSVIFCFKNIEDIKKGNLNDLMKKAPI